MLIREANKRDVPRIFELQKRLFEEDSIYGFAPETAEQIEASINSYFLVAEADGEIIGFIGGKTFVSDGLAVIPKGESCLEIENLYVSPEFRKQGGGGRLVDELLAKARRNDVAYASLYSATKRVQDILTFYERHDFQSWYVQMFQKL